MSLTTDYIKILEYIRDGRNTTASFSDNLAIPAPIANRYAEELEQEGYVRRVSYYGITRFNWLLTDKGVSVLTPLSPDESRLLTEAGINMNQYKILSYVNNNPASLVDDISDKKGLDPREMVSNLSLLVDKKLLNEIGLIRRRLTITDSGRQVVEKFANEIKA